MKIFTAGTFDLFHIGHIRFINKSMELGELTLGLNTDKVTKEFKEELPIMNWEERYNMIKGVFPNLNIVKRDHLNYIQDWHKFIPDIITIGMDWHKKDFLGNMKLDYNFLEKNRIGICYLPYGNTANTTEIKRRIKNA